MRIYKALNGHLLSHPVSLSRFSFTILPAASRPDFLFTFNLIIISLSPYCAVHFSIQIIIPIPETKMPSLLKILYTASAILAVANAQGVLISAQGTKGSPASPGLQVDPTQNDANIINAAEISANVVNECGRTLLAGNIDIGQSTEDQLANKTVTSVTKGSKVAVTIRQGSADGAGPYTCDMDLTSNADGTSGQTNLTVKETDSADGNINLSVTMPKDIACIGGRSRVHQQVIVGGC